MPRLPKGHPLPPMLEADRGVCLTHAEIAERLKISRARVGQIELSAMRKLRALAEARGLTFADLFTRSGDV